MMNRNEEHRGYQPSSGVSRPNGGYQPPSQTSKPTSMPTPPSTGSGVK